MDYDLNINKAAVTKVLYKAFFNAKDISLKIFYLTSYY